MGQLGVEGWGDREDTRPLPAHPHLKPAVYKARHSLAGLSSRTDMISKKAPLSPQPPPLVCLKFIQEAKAFGSDKKREI